MSITLKNEPAEVHFEFLRGDDYHYEFTISDDDGNVIDLTDHNVYCVARESQYPDKLHHVPFTISNPQLGIISLDINNTFTSDLGDSGRIIDMKYRVQLETPDKFVVTFMFGLMRVKGEYYCLGE